MSNLQETTKHFENVYVGVGDKKGREVLGVILKDGTRVEIFVSSTGRSKRVLVNGKEVR